MVSQYQYVLLGLLFLLASSTSASAGFDISMWSLRNTVRDSSGPSSVQDTDRITDIINPLDQSSSAQVGDNIATSSYDFSWLEEAGVGDLHTTFDHEMRFTSDVRTVTRVDIFIETTVDLHVAVDGHVDFSHTVGDFTRINFGFSIIDVVPFDVVMTDGVEGGNGNFEPASGSLTISGETTLLANRTYWLLGTVDNDNVLIDNPVGTYDVDGFIDFTIRPVPEPLTAWLLLPIFVIGLRCRR